MNSIRNLLSYLKEIIRKPEETGRHFRYRDIFFFVQFVRPLWKIGIAGFVLSVLITALSSLVPLSSKVLIDFIIMKEGFEKVDSLLNYFNLEQFIPSVQHFLQSLNLVVISLLLLGMTIGLLGLLQRYLTMRFQQEITFNLQTSLFDHLLRFPLSFFKQKETGYLMSRVSDDVHALEQLFSQSILQIVNNVSRLFFGFVILYSLSAKLTLIVVAVLPVYIFINYYFAGRLRGISQSSMEATAQVSRNLQEVISGVEVIKSYTAEDREVKKVSTALRTAIKTRIKSMMLSTFSQTSAQGTRLLSTVLVMWFGAHEMMKGTMTIGDYVAFTSYMVYLSGPVHSLSLFHLMLQPLFASMDRLMELFRIVPEIADGKKYAIKTLDTVKGDIVFEDVSFSYKQNQPVLKNIDFTVNAGETIALAGPSGVGKTTLINLLLKFYLPQSGTIRLDGQNLRDLDPKWLRQQIGIVSQDVFLFNDTVENNIRYGNPRATREEVTEAASMAHIHAEIEQLPETYDTVIGERGAQLSAGQRQRISIARAFLKNPPMLIFDEPTSALDIETERLIKDSLRLLLKDRTTFIIAHRESMFDIAHKVLVLEHGSIKELRHQHTPLPAFR